MGVHRRFPHQGAGNSRIDISRETASTCASFGDQYQLKRGVKCVAVDGDPSAASQEAFEPWRNPRHDLATDATHGVFHRERAGFGPLGCYGCLRVNCEVTSSGTVFDRAYKAGSSD